MTLIVHHLGVSQSERVVWLCEELGIKYELKKYERELMFAPPEFKNLHPLGSAPVIEDGRVKLAESAACVEYIAQVYGQGKFIIPPGHKNYADYLYWFHFANGSFQPAVGRQFAVKPVGERSSEVGRSSEIEQWFKKKLVAMLALIDDRLAHVPWLAGDDFTAADIMIVFSLTTMRCFAPYDLGDYKNILAYLQRVAARDAYRSAMVKGDPNLEIARLIAAAPSPIY
ncbi:putative glutathione S-transferase [Xylaria venustula]|nr:putative glutathione S-transferase [Xylaria venustula]